MFKLALSLLLATASLAALAQNPLQEGTPVPVLALKNQHDKPADIPTNTRRILFAADNAAAELMTALLDAKAGNWLQETRQVYLADIHKMPSLISRMFALPKLREKPYNIILGREESDLAAWPRQKACVTLIPVTAGKLGKADYACSAAALQNAVDR
jgi:hypothetical protein